MPDKTKVNLRAERIFTEEDPRYPGEDLADIRATSARLLAPLDRARQQARLRDLKGLSFEELARRAQADGTRVVDASEAGVGFRVVERSDKIHFVGIPLVVLPGWQMNPSNKKPGTYFVSAYVKTEHPVPQLGGATEFILNDSSSGISAQLADLRRRCEEAGEDDPMVWCRKGLKRSTYPITDDEIDAEGNVVMDPITRRPRQVPRVDPVTLQPMGEGETFYLNTDS